MQIIANYMKELISF